MNGRRDGLNRRKRLAAGHKNPPRGFRSLCEISGKALHRGNERQPIAPALLAGGNHNLPPVFEFFFGALSGQAQYRARGLHGNDATGPKFHRLLDDPIHLVATCQCLYQNDIERRLPANLLPLGIDRHSQAATDIEPRMQLAAAPIEQHHNITTTEA